MLFKSWLGSSAARVRTFLLCALSLVALLAASACTVTSGGSGSLTVNWTVASSAASTQCTTYGAQSIVIQLVDSAGSSSGSTTAPCSAFSTTIPDLPSGSYTVNAYMVDSSGQSVTATSTVSAVISANANTTTSIDFPTSAFTATTNPADGALTVNWTIASSAVATQCATYNATNLIVTLTDSNGNAYGGGVQPAVTCTAFTTTISNLPPGTYGLTAQLVDSTGVAVTTSTTPVSVLITAGTNTPESVDFPANSFVSTGNGSLVVEWTIASAVASASVCSANGAASIVISVTDASSQPVGTPQTVPCSAATATIANLPPGNYGFTADLVDVNGTAVTTTTAPASVAITAGSPTTSAVDFPSAAFLTNTGSLEIDWTIAMAMNAADCAAHNAANVSIQIYDSSNAPVGSAYLGPCSQFSDTITGLPPGNYTVTGQMVDSNGSPVGTMIPAVPETITADATTIQQFDFPANSFTQ